MRFELIDQVLECDDNRIVATKAVTSAEEYLGDHFPGFAVLPGVMMLEVMVQAGRRLLAPQRPVEAPPLVIAAVRNVRYGNMVRPGQTLTVEVTLRNQDDTGYEFQGQGTVATATGQQVAVQGRFRLQPLMP